MSANLPTDPLDYFAVARHFDAIEIAKGHLEGTLAIATLVIDEDREHDGILLTLERHLKTDLAALDAAYSSARHAILSPLYAIAFPKAPPMGTADTLAEVAGEPQ